MAHGACGWDGGEKHPQKMMSKLPYVSMVPRDRVRDRMQRVGVDADKASDGAVGVAERAPRPLPMDWARESGMPSECKHPISTRSAHDQHPHYADHVPLRVGAVWLL